MNHKAAVFNSSRLQSGRKVCLVWKAKRLFACWYSSALPLHLFFSAVALETDLYAQVSLVLPVYCKLLCHGRARARISGLEGGGRGARAEWWGKGGTLISCEERKKDLGSLSDQLSPHSQLPFSLFWSVCEDLWLSLCSDRSRRSCFGGRFARRAVVFFLVIGSASGLPVEIWIFSHAVGLTLFDLSEASRNREAWWMGVFDVTWP